MKCCVCLLLLAPLCFGASNAATKTYEELAARAKKGDKTVDFRELRIAYSDSSDYDNAPDTESQKKAMWAALNSKDFAEAVKNADAVLDGDFVDLDAQFVDYIAYKELNDTDLAALHEFIFRGLLQSITDSGDGKTPETALQVIEVHEEYVVLRTLGLGLPLRQSSIKKGGHSYDALTFQNPQTKQEATLYFNVDIPAKHGL